MNEGIPEGWTTRKLGEFCFHKTLRAQNKNLRPFSISKILGIVPQEEKFKKRVASTDISNYKIIEPKNFAYDPMLLWDGSINRNNRIETGAVSPAYVVFQISSAIIDSDYFLHFLRSPLTINFYKNISKGTNKRRQKAEFSDFSSGSFNFPPLPEQKKIASILTSVDEVIEDTQKQIDKLQDLKKATMNELLTKGIGHTEFKDSELGRIPKSWEMHSLKNICSLHYGKSPKGIEKKNGKFLIIGTGGVVGRTDSSLYQKPSVVIGRKGTIDRPIYVSDPFWAIDTTYFVETKDVEMKWFFYRLNYENLAKYNEASGVPSLNRETIYSIKICVPPKNEQKRQVVILDKLDSLQQTLSQKLYQTQSLKKSLMQDLLTGKVRVQVN